MPKVTKKTKKIVIEAPIEAAQQKETTQPVSEIIQKQKQKPLLQTESSTSDSEILIKKMAKTTDIEKITNKKAKTTDSQKVTKKIAVKPMTVATREKKLTKTVDNNKASNSTEANSVTKRPAVAAKKEKSAVVAKKEQQSKRITKRGMKAEIKLPIKNKTVKDPKPSVPKQSKVLSKPKLLSTADMVNTAIHNLGEPNGSSLKAIKNYILCNYEIKNITRTNKMILKYLHKAFNNGILVQKKNTDFNVHRKFKMGNKKVPAKTKLPTKKIDKTESDQVEDPVEDQVEDHIEDEEAEEEAEEETEEEAEEEAEEEEEEEEEEKDEED